MIDSSKESAPVNANDDSVVAFEIVSLTHDTRDANTLCRHLSIHVLLALGFQAHLVTALACS